ncbi:restriction endonuclease [Rossellomorea vietnamensis]|uniref:Restriction endonuclease n=1 Tax=Rossellomorea vietnamensis TaxID=218284 RepID=A0A5D4KE66_9BACI|nr:restriction endonuclease [Rossellomorea vietnamensis]TYR75618.1 restriction endonuclease [Rossellomorea vietnamensis]
MNRGYAGFYKDHYLRSSYEYAYARYLDHHSMQWSYEDDIFDLGYRKYKPDFFFYNKNGELVKIVEVKSRNEQEKKRALLILNSIEKLYNVRCELVSYEDLLELYQELPFSLNSVITEWINSKDTTINKAAFGKLNGHYNLRHSAKAKKAIGRNTKKLWASNSISKQRMIDGLRNSGLAQKGKHKKPRETRCCKKCGRPFLVIVTSSKKYCGRSCSGNIAIVIATNASMVKRQQVHKEIQNYIIQWSKDNKDLVQSTPFNKIKSSINPLIDQIHYRFGVKDFRVISKSVFGEDRGRKELLRFMKNICDENVC